MDAYTAKTRDWLNERFCKTTPEGVYIPHQPIYGFRVEPGTETQINRYVITWQMMKALAELSFRSLLDVGCAEGYKTALIRDTFDDVRVRGADLSAEACRRAGEIFGVEADVVDIGELPYRDNSFDVVLCSEVLEHVPDYKTALRELIRVSRRAVVVTVPIDSKKQVARSIAEEEPHAHIHAFDQSGDDFTDISSVQIEIRRFYNALMRRLNRLADAIPRSGHHLGVRHRMYNMCVPLFRWLIGKRAVAFLMKLDNFLANAMPGFRGLVLILLKDPSVGVDPTQSITPEQIVNFTVPGHRLNPSVSPGAAD